MQFFNLLTELNDLAVVLLYVVSSKAVRHGGGTGENRGRSEASNKGEIKQGQRSSSAKGRIINTSMTI